MRNKILSIVLIILVILITALIINQFLNKEATAPESSSRQAKDDSSRKEILEISFYQSKGKKDWIDVVVPAFNDQKILVNNKQVKVEAFQVRSGDSMQDIISGKILPTIWNPASKAWINLLNHSWELKYNKKLISSYQPLVKTALVIGIWEPMARALGYPEKALGWSDLIDLTINPVGWSVYDNPQWGSFKFGHAHPDFSNSALLSVASMVYAAAGKTRGLTIEDFRLPKVKDKIYALEQSIVHYGDSSTWLMEKFVNNGPGYLSALTLYENTVVEANLKYPGKAFPVVAIYPKEGTFWVEHPFAILEADWVTDEQRKAAETFLDFLLAEPRQRLLMKYGYRPAKSSIRLESPIDEAHGANPAIQPDKALEFPDEIITRRIQEMWHQTKKKSTVLMLIDTSRSMNGKPLSNAKKGADLFIRQMEQDDKLGIISFGTNIFQLNTLDRVADTGENAANKIQGLFADGQTPLYDAISLALNILKQEKEQEPEPRLYGIVVLSDGKDTASKITKQELISLLPRHPEQEPDTIKVFSIAYGKSADMDILQEISASTNARMYIGTLEDIENVYLSISSYF